MTDTEMMLREQAMMPRERVGGCMVAHTSCGCFTAALDRLIAYVRAEARVEAYDDLSCDELESLSRSKKHGLSDSLRILRDTHSSRGRA